MPRLDRTGPWGLGPRTGRGLGYCKDIEEVKILEIDDDKKTISEKDPVKRILKKFL